MSIIGGIPSILMPFLPSVYEQTAFQMTRFRNLHTFLHHIGSICKCF
jgi:hypothetical protein